MRARRAGQRKRTEAAGGVVRRWWYGASEMDWKKSRDSLFRGDSAGGVSCPAPDAAEACSLVHIGRAELLKLLRGKGRGRARWSSAFEVMQARKYVEQWAEQLLDYGPIDAADVPTVVKRVYQP